MWLVVGLGNPGEQYANTRHNIGFMVADAFADRNGGAHFQNSFAALVSKLQVGANAVVVLKPQTFMNRSGAAVQSAASFYKIDPKNIIVVHDELDLPFGIVRLKVSGGHGGHNGLRDIARLIGPDFVRVRLGIGRPAFKGAEADYVLGPYGGDEKRALPEQIGRSCDAIEAIIQLGILDAQQTFNQKAP